MLMPRNQTNLILFLCALAATLSAPLLTLSSCSSAKLVVEGGERAIKTHQRQPQPGPYVLIFALDGVGYDQLMGAINSGKAPALAGILGKDEGHGLYEHGYSVPNAISILPSTTIAAWSAIFTGSPSAWNGVPGNEWFVREEMKFVAPVPVSVEEMDDNRAMITDGLVGKSLMSPTLFQQAGVKSSVSLNPVYRGADYFTVVDPISMVKLYAEFAVGKGGESGANSNIYEQLDKDSVPKLLDSIEDNGLPNIQVVYFPGIDLFTHVAENPLPMEVDYLARITDPLVAKILAAYQEYGILDQTYIVVIADHGHTPVIKDPKHALGATPDDGPAAVVKAAGFRPRKFVLTPGADAQDYQAAFAYQGAIAYVYLADRSTCRQPGTTCDWKRPPRFKEDVLPAARAFYESNKTGKATPLMKGTLDLIFARRPTPAGKDTKEYEIFDGRRLVPIWEYLIRHPRPDLLQLDRRMLWLSAGPYGNRTGDILLLSHSGLDRPIGDRYYFSVPYHSWHGSASPQDSHIPLIVARKDYSGADLKKVVDKIAGAQPSQLALVPIVRALLVSEPPTSPATLVVNPPAKADPSAKPAAISR
jgi:hypothetical protein